MKKSPSDGNQKDQGRSAKRLTKRNNSILTKGKR